jgi:sterol desaturase/sphingolipid hydroxylase (fatty acid hydroxylase superfamily)
MWDQVIDYFQTLEKHPGQRMAFLVGGLLLFWIIEGSIPLISLQYKKNKLRHAAVNFGFTVIHLLIHTILAILIIILSDWCKSQGFGLAYWLNANVIGTIIISFLVLDFFGGWLAHLESVLRGMFFFMGIVASGAPMYAVMIFQTILILSTAFTHANISLPRWLDKGLSYVFVSPNMHKVHHHWKQPYTDSNYGAILSIWDRLLGTFMKLEPKQIRYGLDRYYPNDKDEDFMLLMKKPFQKLDP